MLKGLFDFFERLIPPFKTKGEDNPPKNLIGFISFFSKDFRKFLFATAFLNSLIALGEALFFVCLGSIVDWTTTTQPQLFISSHGTALFIMLLCAGVLLPVASILHSLLIHQTLSSNYAMQVRWQLHNFLLGQSVSFFSEEFAGSLANKVMQTSVALRTAVIKLIDVVIHLLVYITTMIVMLMNADIYLCLPLIFWLIFYIFSLFFFIPHLRSCSKEQSVERSNMVGRIVDSYSNITTVKLFGGKGKEQNYAKEAMDGFRNSEYKALRILTLFDVSVQLMNYTLLISLVMLSIWLWAIFLVTPGAIAIAIAIAIRMINMSRWIMWEASAIFENIGMVYDGMTTVSKPVSVIDPKDPIKMESFNDRIEFKNVCFSYKQDNLIFNNLNFSIERGKKVGIVGASGAGKSTLVSLLLRFYDVNSGEILIDGENIKSFKQDDLRELFSMVSQDLNLMHRTIGQNIEYGSKEHLNENQLKKAAQQTDALSFIENLSDFRGENGFDSMVGDRGVKLSGGQKQKIAIARVLVKNAPILILDEATSSLDSQSEQIIQENLSKIMEGRTVLAIAHRLSTLKTMDEIIVIENGAIVERGSHSKLLELDGAYSKLWKLQNNGFV